MFTSVANVSNAANPRPAQGAAPGHARPKCAGFTIVELVTVIILLGILSVVALANLVQPSSFAPSIVTHGLIAESRIAQQLAVSRADAVVSLVLDRSGDDWQVRITTDVDGLIRTRLFDAENTTLQATSGAATDAIDAATPLQIAFTHAGDIADVQIGASTGDVAMGVDLVLSGDSNRQMCIHATGYSTDDACA